MSEYVTLRGDVVFNHITEPDTYLGNSNYKITVALDADSLKTAEKEGLHLTEYKGAQQISAKRKVDFGQPKVYNVDKELVDASHLSLFGDTVTIVVKKGKPPYDSYTYIEKVRVEEKAEGASEYDPAEF